MQTNSEETVEIEHKSKQKFKAGFENNFLVLPDVKTVIGPDGSDWKRLMMEDITTHQISHIGTQKGIIWNLLFHEKTKSLLVGDNNGHVIQYQKCENSNSFTKVKDYGDVGIGPVLSSAQIGDFVIFGGGNKYSLSVIRIPEQELIEGKIKTAFKNVDSLEICEVSDSKVLLSVCGRDPSFSQNLTDVFEIMVNPTRKHKETETEEAKEINYTQKQKEMIESASSKTMRSLSSSLNFYSQSIPQEIINTMVYNIKAYVDGLFQDFVKVVATQLHKQISISQQFTPN